MFLVSEILEQSSVPWKQIGPLLNNTWAAEKAEGSVNQTIFKLAEGYGWHSQLPEAYDPSEVITFPQLFDGTKDRGLIAGDGLQTYPKRVREYSRLDQHWKWEIEHSKNAQFNVASEIFFHSSPEISFGHTDGEYVPSADTRQYELMVWERFPNGSDIEPGVIVGSYARLEGMYVCRVFEDKPNYMAIQAPPGEPIDWLEMITLQRRAAASARAEGINHFDIQEDWFVGAVEAGTEMWGGELWFRVPHFEVRRAVGDDAPDEPTVQTPCPCDLDQAAEYLAKAAANTSLAARLLPDHQRTLNQQKSLLETILKAI